ncbi:sensor histidine kinase [Chitinophaga sp. Hz27]|uniref:sensor histidine kinase n=1 Tax=Chitinophaga sp. Hz27 TaxID=3347169 RepID=UPI0035D818CE
MKKNYWLPGCIVSLGVTLIGTSPRLVKLEVIPWDTVAITILYNFLFSMSCWISHIYMLRNMKDVTGKAARFWLMVLAVSIMGIFQLPYDWVFSKVTQNILLYQDLSHRQKIELLLVRGFEFSALIFLIVNYLRMILLRQRQAEEIAQLKETRLEASLSSLKEQLSPHFLFNTLNTLHSLTQEETARSFIDALANVYRYVLQYKNINLATLQQELELVENYLYILKTRLEDAIIVDMQMDQSLIHTKIPPLTLQLLIENAVKHNVASVSRPLSIHITYEGNEWLVISNNFQPKSSVSTTTGNGLSNIMQRYRLLCDKDIIIEKTTTAFTVKLPVIR